MSAQAGPAGLGAFLLLGGLAGPAVSPPICAHGDAAVASRIVSGIVIGASVASSVDVPCVVASVAIRSATVASTPEPC